jgi:hypothetical protein
MQQERDMSWIHGTPTCLTFDHVDSNAIHSIYSDTNENLIISSMAMKGHT